MKNVIITTPVKGLDKGVVSDTNFVEVPSGSAEEMVNLKIMPDGVVERRDGLHRDASLDPWGSTSTINNTKLFFWEPVPGERHVVSVNPAGISVDGAPVVGPLFWASVNNKFSFAVAYYTQTPPGGADVASSASVWFNNAEHESALRSTSLSFPATNFVFQHYYDKAGVRYIKRTTISYSSASYELPYSTADAGSCLQFASSRNYFVITSPWSLPVVVWKGADGQFRGDYVDIKYRRYEDLPDGLGVTEQPAAAVTNANFETNLKNRGWTTADLTAYKAAAPTVWPSKAMVPWKGKNSTGIFTPADLNKVYFNTSSAPTGSLVLSMATDKITTPTAVCAANARLWYGGFNGKEMAQYVAYTQPVMSKAFMADACGSCIAYNDPTAEYLNQPTALDGGTIKIEGAKDIHRLVQFKDGVVVFAANGVWAITGLSGQVFQGNAFNLYKITDDGSTCGAGGVVEVGESIMYVSKQGIHRIVANPQSRSLMSESVTDGVIGDRMKTLLASLTDSQTRVMSGLPTVLPSYLTRNSKSAVSVYDTIDDKAYFMIGQGQSVTATLPTTLQTTYHLSSFSFTESETWVYDTVRGAWNEYAVDLGTKQVDNAHRSWDGKAVFTRYARPFTFSGGSSAASNNYKDVTAFSAGYTSVTYSEYPSYAVVSSKNAMVDPDKQLAAIRCTFENSNYGTYPSNTDGACKLSVIFDNHDGPSTVRTSPEQDAYRHVPGREPDYSTGNVYRTVQTNLKVRGHGRHFRIKLRSVGVQNFKLVGYALDVSYPTTEVRRVASSGE